MRYAIALVVLLAACGGSTGPKDEPCAATMQRDVDDFGTGYASDARRLANSDSLITRTWHLSEFNNPIRSYEWGPAASGCVRTVVQDH